MQRTFGFDVLVALGLLAEYAAWTVGAGVVTLLQFTRRCARPAAPPATATT